jgi:NAD(P)-dependent dehydrogenase (short-subunit alcohol dehydrogenase family)
VDARFENKVVVITGGGAGIGRTYAHRFAEEGAAIVIADVDKAAGTRVVGEIESTGGRAITVVMDVVDVGAVEAMVSQAVETFGGIDILVNNAAIHLQHAQLPVTMEAVPQWRAVMDVNVIGPLIGTIACREAMAARGGGSVINQSSMAAYSAGGAYGVSKLALNTLTVALAGELADDGIRVNGIAPSLVDSEAAVEWMNDPVRQGVEATIVGNQMIKRLGRMGDLANLVLFLCSEQASFITGQTVLVDGGFIKKPF